MNELQLFNSPEFGDVRVVMQSADEPLFCLADVCSTLGLNSAKVAQRLSKDVLSKHPLLTSGGEQHLSFVNEDGLYDVILDSRKKKAKMFRKWITSEVLPSIRKHGAYATPVTIDRMIADPDFAIQLLSSIKEERQKRIAAEGQIVALSNKIAKLTPKAEYYDLILRSPDAVVVTQIAKDYGMSAREFNERLHVLGIQFKTHGQWVLYYKYQAEGYVDSFTGFKKNGNGIWMCTVWTQKGRLFLYTRLKEANILPVIERYRGYKLPPVGKPTRIHPDVTDATDFYR